MLRKLRFSISIFEIMEMFLESYMNGSASLSNRLSVTIMTCWQMPHLLNLFGLMLLFQINNFPIVFLVLKETLRLVFLKNLVINLVCLPPYVNLAHLVCVFPSFCSCLSFVWLTLFKIAVSYLLLYSICFIVLFSLLYSVSFIGYVDRQLVRYLIAASLCSRWCQESFGMIKRTKYRLSQYLHLIIYECTAIQGALIVII